MPIPQDAPALPRSLLRDDVFTRLRDAIVDGTLAPGEQLRDQELAQWLGVSRTPVREALLRIGEAGLVVARPGRSTVVSEVEADAVRDARDVVAAMHQLAVREAADRIAAADLDRMREANDRFRAAVEPPATWRLRSPRTTTCTPCRSPPAATGRSRPSSTSTRRCCAGPSGCGSRPGPGATPPTGTTP